MKHTSYLLPALPQRPEFKSLTGAKYWPLLALLTAVPALAEEPESSVMMPDFVVSADFRPTEAAETPVSLTEIDEATIEARNAQHLESVLNLAPNVNVSSGSSRGQFYQIRGIGERSQFNAPLNPSVGLVIDGIDFSRTGGAATMFDIESVEILRGPQGTKFGTNALAGTIFLRSKEPTEEFDMQAQAGVGNYDSRNLGIAVGGPLIDNTLLGRISIYGHQSDGYMENEYLDRDDTMEQDELTLRGKLRWLVHEDLTLDFSYLHLDIDNGYDAFTLDNSRHSQANEPGRDQQNTHALALSADWQVSDALILQSDISALDSDITYSFDVDWSHPGQFDPALNPRAIFNQYDRERDNYAIDVRALSDDAGRIFGGTTDWTLGLYHIDQDEHFDQSSNGARVVEGDYDTLNTALYTQFDVHLSESLTLIAGARLEKFDAEYRDSDNLRINTDEVLKGGKIGLNYQANEDHFLYTSFSRGYKSGGVNNDDGLTLGQRKFDSEYNYTLEAGIKSFWLEGDLMTSLAVFYTDRQDAQIKSSTLVGANDFVTYIDNAASAIHQGIEASADWLITDEVRILATLGYLDAKFEDYAGNGGDMEGRQVAHAPEYTYSLGTEYYLNNEWTLRANIEGKDDFYFSDSHNAKADAYSILNASADYTQGNWSLVLWARNLLDEEYATRGLYFDNNPTGGYQLNAPERYIQHGEPRVFGVTLKYDY